MGVEKRLLFIQIFKKIFPRICLVLDAKALGINKINEQEQCSPGVRLIECRSDDSKSIGIY